MIIRLFRRWLLRRRLGATPRRIAARARRLVFKGAKHAFRAFRDEALRQAVRFTEIDQEERNRIFNELVVTNVGLLMLCLEQRVREASAEHADMAAAYWRALRAEIPGALVAVYRGFGIEEKYVKLWDQLIQMRYEEYERDVWEARRQFIASGDEELAEFATDTHLMIIQATLTDACLHISRGKCKRGDPLYKVMKRRLLPLYKFYLEKI